MQLTVNSRQQHPSKYGNGFSLILKSVIAPIRLSGVVLGAFKMFSTRSRLLDMKKGAQQRFSGL